MGKLIISIILIAIFIIGIAIIRDGTETLKNEPLQSTWGSTKAIAGRTKDAYVFTKEKIDNYKNNKKNVSEVGRPLCIEDVDCNTLLQCSEQEPCTCIEGSCFRQGG